MNPCVLITRPEGQHLAFAARCETLGFSVSLLPCLQISACAVEQQDLQQRLASAAIVLFTSANAVRHAQAILPLPWKAHQVHAIGAATARCLEQAGQPLALRPQSPYNSEAYLAQLADQTPQSLLIIKGRGGRGVIQPALEHHGWHVSTLDVYARVRPLIDRTRVAPVFEPRPPDIISVTSDEILDNLWLLCEQHQAVLSRIPLVVNSERCADRARQLGFTAPLMVARPAGDSGQLDCLAQWHTQVFTMRYNR